MKYPSALGRIVYLQVNCYKGKRARENTREERLRAAADREFIRSSGNPTLSFLPSSNSSLEHVLLTLLYAYSNNTRTSPPFKSASLPAHSLVLPKQLPQQSRLLSTTVPHFQVKKSVSKIWSSPEQAVKDIKGDSIVLSGGQSSLSLLPRFGLNSLSVRPSKTCVTPSNRVRSRRMVSEPCIRSGKEIA